MLFDEGDDKMVKTEAFPTIRMKIDRLLKITNEYQFNDLVKAVYCINLCINNRSVLESCLALNACLIEYEEKGSKRIGTYDEFKGFFGKIYDVMKPGIADDYTVEDFGEVQLRYNDKFYRVIIGTGHNNVYACLNFLPTLARNISREEELCLALEYVSGTIDYFIEENKNDGVVEKRFVLPTEILFYKVQKFFKEEVKKYDILELDSLMMSEGTTIEKSHFVCREDNIYPLYNVSLLIDLYDIWENKIDFKEQISVANEGIIDRIYSLFEMDRSRSCSIFAPAMIFPEQKYDSSQRTYTFIAKASRGVVVALNADEYEEGQLEKEIANIEKYHKSGTLHIAETFNRFDKSGLRGIHIPADMPIEYLIYDSFMNPNQMHMSLGEEGKKRKTCTALDVIYYLNFMDDIDELFEYLSYSNEKDYESSFGFGSDAALYFTWKNQDRYIAKGAIIFNMVDVGYDTENEAVVDYFKEELKDYPFHMRDYLFREPFSWKIEKRDFDTYEYTVKHGMGFGGIYLPLPQKNYVFLTNNVEFYKDVKDFGEYRQWIQLLEEIITEGFDSIKCVFEDNKAISNTGIQIAFMPIEYAVHAGHESFLYEDRIYVYSDAQYYSHKWIIRYVVKDINRIYEDIQEAKNRSTEFNILREILIPLLDRMPDLNELFESKRKKVSLEKKKVGVFSASVEYKWDNNVQNFSPEDYHYHEVRKRIANVCYGNMIKPGIYRGQEANQIIRAMQKAIIEDFEGEVSKYSWSELHYSLLDYHSTLLHDIDINWKRYGSYSGLDEKKDKEVRDRIIDQREKAKHDDRNTLYLIETNLYLHCESETLATIDDINLLLAYANWLVVLNDVADMCHFADNEAYIEITDEYLILTGSAGNGKTNLLCSISELLVNLKQTTIFLNAREIEGDILDFIFDELGLPDLYKKHKEIYLYLVNLLLTVQNKFLFIIVDAINENDSDGFGNQISAFINKIADYSRAKIVVSCRNEYYKERFRKYLVEKVNIPVFEFDLKEQHYTSTAINRIIKTYSNHFNYSGNISLAVKSVLSEQLLLLRIFFEVNKDSNADVYSIRKHEIFAQYIEKLKQNNREYLETVLDTVTDFMIHSDNYDEISITDLEKTGITSGDIRKTVNSGILLSKKLVFHEGTIARNEKEVVYFVFDEMRDYCLARQILLNNISAYNVDGESVIEKLKQLKATGASCTEGVIHYCYVFFKTDELVSKLGQTEKMCNSILDLYRIPEGGERKSYWSMRYREELQNLGLRIILTSGLELTDFEITYIQDCLRKDPYEDGGMFFDTMLDGTLYGGIYNLDIYLGILFGLKNKDAILNTFHTISARNNMDDRFIPEDFIKYYNELSDSERKLQIQKIAELFLLCFKLHDKDKQEELEDFFYNLPTHDKVQNDMILEMRIACGLEVKDYE